MLERVESGLGRVDAELRNQLMPALTVLRERVEPGHWQEFLRANRLNPATVRKWRARQRATTTSLLNLFGESRKICLNKKPRLGETPEEALLKAKRGFEELLRGDLKYASEIAKQFLSFKGMTIRNNYSCAADHPLFIECVFTRQRAVRADPGQFFGTSSSLLNNFL
jgi:hypothetical protein